MTDVRKFIIKGIVFALPVIPLLVWCEFELAHIPNSFTKKKQSFEKVLSTCEVLVLGSSHTVQGVDPAQFGCRGFNMALHSQNLYYDWEILSRYSQRMPNLKMVIFNISYSSLESGSCEEGIEFWRAFFYRRFYHIPAESWKSRWDIRNFSLIALYGPSESLRYLKARPVPDLAPAVMDNGWYCVLPDETAMGRRISDALGKARADSHTSAMEEDNIGHNLDLLRSSLRLCLSRGVMPAIVTTPVWNTYSEHIDEGKYQRMQNCIRDVCCELNVRYFNYMRDGRFAASDFADNDHLNSVGAKKFSRILNDEVVAPALSNRPF